MTSELEQEFFRVFGIYKKCSDKRYEKCMGICYDCKYFKHSEITAEKLLKMICILNKHYAENFQCATMLVGDTVEKIKECILKDCIEQSQHIKSEIQQLFSE